MKAGFDGSNDDPNLFCNFPRIDNFSDVPLAKNLLSAFKKNFAKLNFTDACN